jgi:hypothetical protein
VTYHVTIMQCWTEAEDTKVKLSCSYIPQYDINICIPQAEQIMCTVYSWELCESWINVNLTWTKLLLAVLHCRPQFRKAASLIFWIMTGTSSRAPLQIPAIFILWLISNLNLHFTVGYVLSSSPSLKSNLKFAIHWFLLTRYIALEFHFVLRLQTYGCAGGKHFL